MNDAQLRQVLAALVMSSPHTDRLYRWQDDSWVAQRAEAIALVDKLLSERTSREIKL